MRQAMTPTGMVAAILMLFATTVVGIWIGEAHSATSAKEDVAVVKQQCDLKMSDFNVGAQNRETRLSVVESQFKNVSASLDRIESKLDETNAKIDRHMERSGLK
jgi:peptidoglycan hydrolase CwlO-like protein